MDSDAVAFDKLDVPSYWQFRGYGHPFYVNIRYRFPYTPPVIPTTGKAGRTNKKGAVAHVTAPLLFVESKNKKHVFVKIKACATDFLENQKFSMDL